MTDGNAENLQKNNLRSKVSVKVYEDTRDLMERYKMRFKSSERPDYADIVEPAVTDYLAKRGTTEKPRVLPIRDQAHDADLRKILSFFEEATGPHASAGDSTIARLILDRLGIDVGAKKKKSAK